MKRTLSLMVCLLILLTMVPFQTMAEGQYMYVNTRNGGSVNMRQGPSTDEEVVGTIPYGAKVYINDWLLGGSFVEVDYKRRSGFVALSCLSDYPPAPKPQPTKRPQPKPQPQPQPVDLNIYANFAPVMYNAVVVPSTPTNFVNLRWGPSTSTPVQSRYFANEQLVVLQANNSWCQVYDPARQTCGFMMKAFLTYVSPINNGLGIVQQPQAEPANNPGQEG